MLFWVTFIIAMVGLACTWSVKCRPRECKKCDRRLSLDRFLLLKGWRNSISLICYAFSYGVLATYIAIYGKEELGITGGTGLFFLLLAVGLILSRLAGSRTLRRGLVVQNATIGTAISLCGYLLFASLHNVWGYYGAALIIGLGNGHMFPAFQTMYINLAESSQRGTANSTLLVSWDIGIGLGTLVGGIVSEHVGYHAAFWVAFAVNLFGTAIFHLLVRGYFERNKLR